MIPLGGRRPAGDLVLDLGADVLHVDVSARTDGWELVPVAALRVMSGHFE